MFLIGKELNLGPLALLSSKVEVSPAPTQNPARESFLYGVLYNLIGIGCTGAMLLGLILYTLTIGDFWTAFSAFAVFSASMGILMLIVTALVGLSQATLIRTLKTNMLGIRRASGAVMLVIGALTVAFVLEGNRIFTKLFFPFLP
jgi:cytochrome c biogenesis protein CcdA